MRQHRLGLVMVVAALGGTVGCGDNRGGPGFTDVPDVPEVPGDARDPESPMPVADAGVDAGMLPPVDPGSLSCDVAWHDVRLGTSRDDQLWGMATDKDHNLYVSGFEDGVVGVTNIEPDGNSRGVVLQIDTAGAVRWKAVLDTAATDAVEDVEIEAATGRLYGVGRTSGAFDGFANQGQFDAFLFALDSSGQITKIFQTGDERPQHPRRLSLAADHSIAVAGYDDIYIPTNHVVAQEDGFIASFERATPATEFTENYVQKVKLTAQNRLHDVVVDRDGSGSMYITSYVGAGPRSGVGIFVKKLNRDGSEAWSNRISSSTADAANAVALSPANELFVTGATFQKLGSESFGQQDAFVLKLDKATGAILWAAQAGSSSSDYPTSLAFDDAGNIYLAGDTLGAVVAGGVNRGGTDLFAMKLDATGALLSSWQTGTPGYDLGTSMVVNCGRVLVGGYTMGAQVDGSAGPTGDDIFVLEAAL